MLLSRAARLTHNAAASFRPSLAPIARPIAAQLPSRGRSLVARSTAGGAPEVKIDIEGMMCDGCSSRIETVLKGMPDTVKSVTVNLEGKSATVNLAKGAPGSPEAQAAAAQLVDVINGLGFEAKVHQ